MVRSTRPRAVLAAGLVLGTGVVATLAAWTDQEFATGTFAAGTFDLEGAFTEAAGAPQFAQHPDAASAGVLEFDLHPPNLSPGDVVQAPLAIRRAAGTTFSALVTRANTTTGTTTALTYGVTRHSAWGCATAVTGTVIAAGAALEPRPGVPLGPLAAGTGGAPRAADNPGRAVTAGPGRVSGQSGTATFVLSATSQPT